MKNEKGMKLLSHACIHFSNNDVSVHGLLKGGFIQFDNPVRPGI